MNLKDIHDFTLLASCHHGYIWGDKKGSDDVKCLYRHNGEYHIVTMDYNDFDWLNDDLEIQVASYVIGEEMERVEDWEIRQMELDLLDKGDF